MWLTNTRIYQRSLELVAVVAVVVERLPRGHSGLADQLRRASASVTLNFAEGWTRKSSKDRQRFFALARGSALEVHAALDVAKAVGAIDEPLHAQGTDHADALVGMLGRFH